MNQTVIIVIAVISVLVIAGVIVFFVIRNPEDDDVEDDVEDDVVVDVDVGGAGVTKIVKVIDNTFDPESLTIKKGDSVQWNFINGENHSVVSNAVEDGSAGDLFDSGVIDTGGLYIRKFDTVGTFAYHCDAHQTMTGTIIVE